MEVSVSLSDFLKILETKPPKQSFNLLKQRFQKNYDFFKKTLPHLSKLLTQKTTQYHLYFDDRGYNIALNSGKLLYEDFIKTSKLLALDPISNSSFKKSFNQQGVVKYSEPTLPITTKSVNSIIQEIQKDKSFDNTSVYFGDNFLPPITLFGLMGGLQVEYLIRNNKYIHKLFIYEPIVDFFIISNFFIDYENLFTTFNDRFFLVVSGYLQSGVVREFFSTHTITTNYIRLEQSLYEDKRIEDAKALFFNIQRQNTRGWGTIDDELLGLKNRLINTKNPKKPQFAYLAKEININFPICVVGAGPSLEFLLPFIKKNQNKMIIFSAGTALKPLINFGIKPDFQIEIERRVYLKDVLEDAKIDDNTTILMADIAHPKTTQVVKNTLFFVRDSTATTALNKASKVITFANPVVGNAAFSIAMELSDTIFMCGLDVGFKKDGKMHIKNSFYDHLDDRSKEMIPTRGNISNNIYTNSLLSASREMFELCIASKKNKKVFNLSDGAYIQGAKKAFAKDIKFSSSNKQKALKKLKTAFIKEGFFKEFNKDYKQEIKDYIDNFFKILNSKEVKNTKDLFFVIDKAFVFTHIQNQKEPFSGILLGGTLWHILYSLLIGCMHLQKEDISSTFKKSLKALRKQLNLASECID
jgi:hypothetical protein